MDNQKPHRIFLSDPQHHLGLVNKYVKITLRNKNVREGTIYTIDPVSESVVLLRRNGDALEMEIILKSSVEEVDECEAPSDQLQLETAHIFHQQHNLSKKAVAKQKEELKAWLLGNMVPVTEADTGDSLLIENVEVRPPYTAADCFCNNPIVLTRIQNLIKAMPS